MFGGLICCFTYLHVLRVVLGVVAVFWLLVVLWLMLVGWLDVTMVIVALCGLFVLLEFVFVDACWRLLEVGCL